MRSPSHAILGILRFTARSVGAWTCACLFAVMIATPSLGQTQITLEQFGVGNGFRPGGPIAARLKITSDLDEATSGLIQWEIENADGDVAEFSREVTLQTRGSTTTTWLYGILPPTNDSVSLTDETWTFRLFSTEEGEKLEEITSARLSPQSSTIPSRPIQMTSDQVLVIGPNRAGLDGYEAIAGFPESPALNATTAVSTNNAARDLPDSWEGLAPFSTVVWTTANDPRFAPGELDGRSALEAALRDWVTRGGHLVIILPASSDPWRLGQEATALGDLFIGLKRETREGITLASILPALSSDATLRNPDKTVSISAFNPTELPPEWRPLAAIRPRLDDPGQAAEPNTSDQTAAEAMAEKAAIILKGDDTTPSPLVWAIRRNLGHGAIDLLGIDVADPDIQVQQAGRLPQTGVFWRPILGRRATAPSGAVLAQIKAADRLNNRTYVNTNNMGGGALVSSQIGLGGAAAQGVLAAMGLFAVYWLVAGPGGFAVLRHFKLQRHAWLVFVGTSVGFAILAWIGSRALRQEEYVVKHLTVLSHVYNPSDVDGEHSQLDLATTWFSAPLPGYGMVDVQLGPEDDTHNLLEHFSPPPNGAQNRFPNSGRYEIPFKNRARYEVPARATSAEFVGHYLGVPDDSEGAWGGTISVDANNPLQVIRNTQTDEISLRGTLVNDSGVDFQNAHLFHIYPLRTPGEQITGSVLNDASWLLDELPNYGIFVETGAPWRAGDSLDLAQVMYTKPRLERSRAGKDALRVAIQRSFVDPYTQNEAWGGMGNVGNFGSGDKLRYMSMLSLYHLLPPPLWFLDSQQRRPETVRFHHFLGRSIDLSRHFGEPGLVVIAFADDVPNPVPISIDGREGSSVGRVMLHWLHPLRSAKIEEDVEALANGANWTRSRTNPGTSTTP
ncbi:MAG: hypothetical protein MK085_09965 [Phycisphaerales bacterium]|nr:hypothetical protein [Phycisphaerales bacterium]